MFIAALLFIIVGVIMIGGGIIAGRQTETDMTPKPHTIRTTLISIGTVDIAIGMTIIVSRYFGS